MLDFQNIADTVETARRVYSDLPAEAELVEIELTNLVREATRLNLDVAAIVAAAQEREQA